MSRTTPLQVHVRPPLPAPLVTSTSTLTTMTSYQSLLKSKPNISTVCSVFLCSISYCAWVVYAIISMRPKSGWENNWKVAMLLNPVYKHIMVTALWDVYTHFPGWQIWWKNRSIETNHLQVHSISGVQNLAHLCIRNWGVTPPRPLLVESCRCPWNMQNEHKCTIAPVLHTCKPMLYL